VRFALLDRSVELEDLLRSLGGAPGGAPGGGGGGASAPRSGTPRSEPRQEPRSEARPISRAESAPRASAVVPAAAVSAAPRVVVADAPRPIVAATGMLELSKVVAQWDSVVDRIRAAKPTLASALEHASPVAVNASGTVTIALDQSNDFYAHAINGARVDIADALREWFASVQRLELRRDDAGPSSPPKRLTGDMVRAERVAMLRKRDPVLGAAIDALDLDLTD
ncbi:MAG: hypothetical protein ABI205_11640, partial [Gemmatimonadaceae bacterium]